MRRRLQAQRALQAEELPARPVASEAEPAPPEMPAAEPVSPSPQPVPARKIGFEVSNHPQKTRIEPVALDQRHFSCGLMQPSPAAAPPDRMIPAR